MAARFCDECGMPTRPGNRYCINCGAALPLGPATGTGLPAIAFGPAAAGYPTSAPPVQMAWRPASAEGSRPLAMLDIEYPPRASRLLNGLLFIKFILAVPHLIILYAFNFAASIVWFISWWVILFTGRYPRDLFDFMLKYLRWQANVFAYLYMLRDEYPPFSGSEGRYPVHLTLNYPDRLSRALIFFKWWLLIIPNVIVLYLFLFGAVVVTSIAWLAIIFTGRYPPGLFRYVVGVYRWVVRLNTYVYFLTDRYPPFSTAAVPA